MMRFVIGPGLPSMTDGAVVELHGGDDLRRCAGEEKLIRRVEVVARQLLHVDLQPELGGDVEHGLPGDAPQGTRIDGRGEDFTALHNENVVPRTLGDVALLVEHEAFIGFGEVGLDLGHDVVQVIERLHRRAQRTGSHAARGAGHDRHPTLVGLRRIKLDGRGDDDDRGLRAAIGAEAEVALPAGHEQADVAVAQIILADRLERGGLHLLPGQRDGEQEGARRIPQTLEVFGELEDPAIVKADALENAVAVE